MSIKYRCPVCGQHDNLHVDATMCCHIDQFEYGDVSTEKDDEPAWDDTSTMHCLTCRHSAIASTFWVEPNDED